jgi:hypothetical protein
MPAPELAPESPGIRAPTARANSQTEGGGFRPYSTNGVDKPKSQVSSGIAAREPCPPVVRERQEHSPRVHRLPRREPRRTAEAASWEGRMCALDLSARLAGAVAAN